MSMLDFFNRKKHEEDLIEVIEEGSFDVLSDMEVLTKQVQDFLNSERREWMITGNEYYDGQQDILAYERTVIGEGGACTTVNNLPNNKIIDNQYAKLVDQKVNYQLGKPITIETENENYEKDLKRIFGKKFQRSLRNLGYDVMNGGIGWLYPYIDGNEIKFKKFAPYEILPFWKDSDRTELESAVRVYKEVSYEGTREVIKQKVDIMTVEGVTHHVLENGLLIEDVETVPTAYISATGEEGEVIYFNWGRVPLIPFKFNHKEIPLIKRVKSLQDGINMMISTFMNNMQEDARNTILVVENYGGENLGEFRQNLAKFGAVKVDTDGDVRTLTVEVNATNYKEILKVFKDALISNGRGYDSKDDRMSSNPNQMNIQSMYSDIELDANGIEVEFQASFEDLLYFVNTHLANIGKGNYMDEEVTIIFNRDMLSNEKEIVDLLVASNFLSNETKISMHPYINDVQREMDRIKAEKKVLEAELNTFGFEVEQ